MIAVNRRPHFQGDLLELLDQDVSATFRPSALSLPKRLAKIHERSLEILEDAVVRVTPRRALQVFADAATRIVKNINQMNFPKRLVIQHLKHLHGRVIYGFRESSHDLTDEVDDPFYTRLTTGGEGCIDIDSRK